MTKTAALAMASLCMAAGPALADETGFYVGVNALDLLSTYRRPNLDNATAEAFGGAGGGFTMGPSSVDRDHLSWAVDVGYRVTRNFGVEVGYIDLGSLRYSGFGTVTSSTDGNSEVHLSLDVRSHGPALAAVGVLPMTNAWELDARVGAFEAKTKTSYHTTVAADEQSGAFSATSTNLLASVGTAFSLTTHCVLRLDYLRIQKIKEKALEHSFNVDGVTAGLALVF